MILVNYVTWSQCWQGPNYKLDWQRVKRHTLIKAWIQNLIISPQQILLYFPSSLFFISLPLSHSGWAEVILGGSEVGTQLGAVGVCTRRGTVFGRGCNWGRNRGNRSNGGEGGPQGQQWRADRRCSDTRRLEEPHIFSVIPGGQRYVRAPACMAADAHRLRRTHTHTHKRERARAQTHTHNAK